MPPPMPNPSKRITANPIRPARYRPGKAVQEEESSEEDEDEEPEQQKRPAARPQPRAQPQKARVPIQEEEDDDDEEGFVTEEEDEVLTTTRPQSKPSTQARSVATTQHTAATTQVSFVEPVAQQGSEDEESDEESEEEESSETESSSEDEPQRKFQRPTFIKKSERQKSSDPINSTPNPPTESTGLAGASSTPDLDEQTRRLAQADLYIKDKLERDAIARSQGKKAWDDDDEISPEAMVDDTDNIDPAAEHAAWKLRELKRLKRDREALEAREREIEEIERRRNLTQEERDAEDRAYLEKQKEDRDEGRSKANYLAKYHHKGAFFQDDEMAEVLRKRDIMGAKFEDEISDKSALPEYMRVRDMTKLGKKGRTRYTDLKNEDTGRFGDAVRKWKGAGYANNDDGTRDGQDMRGVDERFLPDSARGRDTDGPTGANASAVGQRGERRYPRSRSRSPEQRRDRYRDRSRDREDTYRPRRRSSYSSSRSRSRTPPRRKRSHSPYADRDKRRRVEVD